MDYAATVLRWDYAGISITDFQGRLCCRQTEFWQLLEDAVVNDGRDQCKLVPFDSCHLPIV